MQWIPSVCLSTCIYKVPGTFIYHGRFALSSTLFSCLCLSAEDEELCIIINSLLFSLFARACEMVDVPTDGRLLQSSLTPEPRHDELALL